MNHFARILASVALVSTLALAYGCGGQENGGSGGNGGNGGNGGSGAGPTCDQTCGDPSACESLACACGDGSVVNTQSCDNGCCAAEADACPDACSDKGGWNSGSSSSSGSSSTGMMTGAAFGADCASNDDCADNLCFYVDPNDENVQKCTKECSFGTGECGAGWDCAEITKDGATTYLCVMQ